MTQVTRARHTGRHSERRSTLARTQTQTTKLHTIHSLRTRAAFSTLFLRPVLLQHRPVAMLLSVASLDLGAPASLWITDRAHSSAAAAAAAADHTATHTTHCMRAAAGASPLLLPPSPLLPSNPPLSFLSDDEPEPLSFTQSLSPAHLSCHHIIQLLRRRPSNHEPRTLIGRSSSPASPLAPSPPTAHHSPQSVAQAPSPHLLNRTTTTNPYTQEEEKKRLFHHGAHRRSYNCGVRV